MGNPAIFPLIYNRGSKDVILVHINPIERKKLPKLRRRRKSSIAWTKSASTLR